MEGKQDKKSKRKPQSALQLKKTRLEQLNAEADKKLEKLDSDLRKAEVKN